MHLSHKFVDKIRETFPVDEVALVRSRTLPGGAVHEVLERFVLAG